MSRSGSFARRISVGVLIVGLAGGTLGVLEPVASAVAVVNCNAGGNLQAKIDAASAGSTVFFTGTCYGNFVITKNLTLTGKPSGTLDGMSAGITLISTANLHLNSLAVTGGASTVGAGVLHVGSALFLNHVTVTGNHVTGSSGPAGGGLFTFGTLSLKASTITNNTVAALGPGSGSDVFAYGGGIWALGNATISGSTIQGNSVTMSNSSGTPNALGGGIWAAQNLTITSSKLIGNRVGTQGDGGVAFGPAAFEDGSSGPGFFMHVTKSLVSGNVAGATSANASTAEAGFPLFVGPQTGGTSPQGSLAISGSTVSGNKALADGGTSGAGVALGGPFSNYGSVSVSKSAIKGNLASSKGTAGAESAYVVGATTKLTLSSSVISGNSLTATSPGTAAAVIGALGNTSLSMTNSTYDRNTFTATSTGAAAEVEIGVGSGSTFTIKGSTLSRNVMTAKATAASQSAVAIGAGVFTSGTGSMQDSTIALNKASATASNSGGTAVVAGGGFFGSGTANIIESTLAGNLVSARGASAQSFGGGVYGSSAVTLRDTILGNNVATTGRDCYQGISSAGFNLISKTAGCAFGSVGSDKLNKDPKLGPLANYGGPTQTMLPSTSSPVLDAVPGASCPIKKDQRGVKRPQGPKCDIGAVERRSTDPTVKSTSLTRAYTPTALSTGGVSSRVAKLLAPTLPSGAHGLLGFAGPTQSLDAVYKLVREALARAGVRT